MAAIPVGNPVLEGGPCGAVLRRAANSHPRDRRRGARNRPVIGLSGAGDDARRPPNERAFGTEKACERQWLAPSPGATQCGVPPFAVLRVDNCPLSSRNPVNIRILPPDDSRHCRNMNGTSARGNQKLIQVCNDLATVLRASRESTVADHEGMIPGPPARPELYADDNCFA